MFEDVIISKSGFLTMNFAFWYQKVHFWTFSVVAVASSIILSAILCIRDACKSILRCLLNSLTPKSSHQNYDSSPYIKEDIGDFMIWRPSCPQFCKHVTDMSEINFNMPNRFLELKYLCVATKSMCLAHIFKKILRILSFCGHLGRHLKYFNFP